MKKMLCFNTAAGMFYIGRSVDGRFHPIYNNESLGSYATAEKAIEDLAANATHSALHYQTRALVDTSKLGISSYISEWKKTG
jgi:hypothetical protein